MAPGYRIAARQYFKTAHGNIEAFQFYRPIQVPRATLWWKQGRIWRARVTCYRQFTAVFHLDRFALLCDPYRHNLAQRRTLPDWTIALQIPAHRLLLLAYGSGMHTKDPLVLSYPNRDDKIWRGPFILHSGHQESARISRLDCDFDGDAPRHLASRLHVWALFDDKGDDEACGVHL